MIHTVVHTYHPEKTEPINVDYQDMKPKKNNSCEVSHFDVSKDPILSNRASNVQLSKKLPPREYPLLPDSKEKNKIFDGNSVPIF